MKACKAMTSISITPDSKCVGCEGIGEALSPDQAEHQRSLLIPDWSLTDNGTRLRRSIVTRSFKSGMEYLNQIAQIADVEGHHPDLTIHSYNHIDIVLWTHTLGGVTENDLIMAVKIDTVPFKPSRSRK